MILHEPHKQWWKLGAPQLRYNHVLARSKLIEEWWYLVCFRMLESDARSGKFKKGSEKKRRQVHVKGGEQPSYDAFAKTLPQL